MTVTVKHSKTNAISDWTQAQLDEQIALGNFAEGTVLADIVLPSDWNNDHTLTGVGTMAEQNANSVAITGGTATLSSVTTPSVTATTGNLTLSAISTGNVNLATLGGTQFKAIEATGSVNIWNVRGGDGSTTSPRFTTEGTGTNIAGQFNTKGTGALQFFSGNTEQMRITNTASAVNYVQVTGSVTSAAASSLGGLSFTGSDASPNFAIGTKGTGYIAFYGGAATNVQAFRINTTNAANTGNLLQVQGAAAGSAPSISAISGTSGTDANIDLALTPKGTGLVRFGTHTATADTAISGYITIKDSGGTTRKLAVIT